MVEWVRVVVEVGVVVVVVLVVGATELIGGRARTDDTAAGRSCATMSVRIVGRRLVGRVRPMQTRFVVDRGVTRRRSQIREQPIADCEAA